MRVIIKVTHIDTPKQRFIPMSERISGRLGYRLYPVIRTVEV